MVNRKELLPHFRFGFKNFKETIMLQHMLQNFALMAVATVSLLTCLRCCAQGKVGPKVGLILCRVKTRR